MRKPFTDLRKSILAFITSSPVPVTAQQVMDAIKEKCDLSNIYRGVRFLERRRLIESFSLDCEKEGNARFYAGSGDRHAHFIHCEKCHQFTRIRECLLDGQMRKLEKNYNYRISRHLLLFIGTCEQCAHMA